MRFLAPIGTQDSHGWFNEGIFLVVPRNRRENVPLLTIIAHDSTRRDIDCDGLW